jgi:hypothetical protein
LLIPDQRRARNIPAVDCIDLRILNNDSREMKKNPKACDHGKPSCAIVSLPADLRFKGERGAELLPRTAGRL